MKEKRKNIELIRVVEHLRVKRIIKKDVDISRETGFSPSVVSNYLSGRVTASENFLKRFEEVYGIDVFKFEQESNESLVNDDPKNYLTKRRDLKNSKENTLSYYDVGANGATKHEAEILPVKKSEGVLHISDLFRGSEYAIRISGNSMTPNYPSGAIIGIRQIDDKQIIPGSVYVIEKGSDLWIKRLYYSNDDQTTGLFECISDNTMKFETGPRSGKYCYPPFEIKIDDVRKLFKVTGIYKPNELTVIN